MAKGKKNKKATGSNKGSVRQKSTRTNENGDGGGKYEYPFVDGIVLPTDPNDNTKVPEWVTPSEFYTKKTQTYLVHHVWSMKGKLNENEKPDMVKATEKIAGMYWQDALKKYKKIEGTRSSEFNNIAKTMFDVGQCLLIAIHLRKKLFVISKTKIPECVASRYKVRYCYWHNMLTTARGRMLIRIYLLPKQKKTTDEMVAFLGKLLGLIKTRALEKAKSEEEISNIRKYVEKTESLYSRFKQDIFNMEGFPDTVPEDHTNYMEYYTQNDHGIKHIYKNKTVAIEESNQDKAHMLMGSSF
jgi:hypothetical protein